MTIFKSYGIFSYYFIIGPIFAIFSLLFCSLNILLRGDFLFLFSQNLFSVKGHWDWVLSNLEIVILIARILMILILRILGFENKKSTTFQFNWSVGFRDINFVITFNVQISKCSMRIRV